MKKIPLPTLFSSPGFSPDILPEKVGRLEKPHRRLWSSTLASWLTELPVTVFAVWQSLSLSIRHTVVVAFHLILVMVANGLAVWLRFDGQIPPQELALAAQMLPVLVA